MFTDSTCCLYTYILEYIHSNSALLQLIPFGSPMIATFYLCPSSYFYLIAVYISAFHLISTWIFNLFLTSTAVYFYCSSTRASLKFPCVIERFIRQPIRAWYTRYIIKTVGCQLPVLSLRMVGIEYLTFDVTKVKRSGLMVLGRITLTTVNNMKYNSLYNSNNGTSAWYHLVCRMISFSSYTSSTFRNSTEFKTLLTAFQNWEYLYLYIRQDFFLWQQTWIGGQCRCRITASTSSKSSIHYLNDTIRFKVSSKDLSSGISTIHDEGPLLQTSNHIVLFSYSEYSTFAAC
jgi:hypothetical protein